MTKAKRYDTVALVEPVGDFSPGTKGAVVEVYTTPYEAYDVEIVTDAGATAGLLNAVRPQQFDVDAPAPARVRLSDVCIEDDGASASVGFSDGKRVKVRAEELYALSG